MRRSNYIALYFSAFITIVLILFALFRDTSKLITLKDANRLLLNKDVKEVVISKDYVYLKTDKDLYKIASSEVNPKMFVDYKVEVKSNEKLLYILFFILFLGVGSILIRVLQKKDLKLFTKDSTKQNFKNIDEISEISSSIQPIKSDIKFDDIGGIQDVKAELEEIIDFLKNPKRYKNFGARMPRGVLLVGPPGVGKTMIAKAVANEAGVSFYYQSGASFVQIYVGMGAKRVHDLFSAAKNSSPAIIFIDEIDAVGKKRDGQRNDEREATLNQLLTEMDGFENSSGIIVIAATNKIDVLDSALLRAGRFDRRIFVELPTKSEREAILEKYLEKIPNSVDVKTIASMTVGFNGASLAALVNEAALLSLRENSNFVTIEHFHKVKDKVIFGKKKLQLLTQKQKEYRVVYQSAKVVCATYFDLPFEKLMLSSEKLTPQTDEPLIKSELEARIKMLLAGIVACNISYNEHASSAKSDLDEAKELVKKMLFDYGMGSDLIAKEEDEKVFLNRLYEETEVLLKSLESVLKSVETILNDKESITKDEVLNLLKKY